MTAPTSLPMGFADQVLDLQMKLEEEESLEVIQILSQMYRIAVDYYIEIDIKRANYFQKKLNNLVLKSLNAKSVDSPQKVKTTQLPERIKKQMNHYEQCGKTYIKSIVENNEKTERRLRLHVEAEFSKQQENLNGRRMLRRVRSTGKL